MLFKVKNQTKNMRLKRGDICTFNILFLNCCLLLPTGLSKAHGFLAKKYKTVLLILCISYKTQFPDHPVGSSENSAFLKSEIWLGFTMVVYEKIFGSINN